MNILECKSIKEKEIIKLKQNIKEKLTLAVIQIGNFKENEVYLRNKKKIALELGIDIIELKYTESDSEEKIKNKILELNLDETITGIMIQKPILSNYNYQKLVNYIDYRKDVDGVGIINQERLINNKSCLIPCTAQAVMKILEDYKINIANKQIAIIGKSKLVGMPLYNILSKKTQVILCDSKTKNLNHIIEQSDIIISAIGKANYFNNNNFKDGQTIIDVGTNYLNDKLVGDVDSSSIDKQLSITPVPGGVGQLTTIYLFWNLIVAKNFK